MPYSLLDGVRRIYRSRLAVPALLLPLLFVVGCGGGGGGGDIDPNPPPTGTGALVNQPGWSVRSQTRALGQKKWTFLVYMNAA
ncbi:MAG: hypothetical protein V4671_24910, partial [Armatimonadota bacterium]